MNKHVLISIFFLNSMNIYCQNPDKILPDTISLSKNKSSKSKYYIDYDWAGNYKYIPVSNVPEYSFGKDSFEAYLANFFQKNIPASFEKINLSIFFDICRDGTVCAAQLLEGSLSERYDTLLLDAIEGMRGWNPGNHKGDNLDLACLIKITKITGQLRIIYMEFFKSDHCAQYVYCWMHKIKNCIECKSSLKSASDKKLICCDGSIMSFDIASHQGHCGCSPSFPPFINK